MPVERRPKRRAADPRDGTSGKTTIGSMSARLQRPNGDLAASCAPSIDEYSNGPHRKATRAIFQSAKKQGASIRPFKDAVWEKNAEMEALIQKAVGSSEDPESAYVGFPMQDPTALRPETHYAEGTLERCEQLLVHYRRLNDEYRDADGPEAAQALPPVQAGSDITRVRELFLLALEHGRRIIEGLVTPNARGLGPEPDLEDADELADMAAELFAEAEARLGQGQWGGKIKGVACAWLDILGMLSSVQEG